MPIYPPLRISLLPIDINVSDFDINLANAAAELDSLPAGTDIAVLPELFSTGFIRNPEKAYSIAKQSAAKALEMLREEASSNNCAIAGSMMCIDTDSDKIYNRAFFVEPCGECHYYDKRHLFALGAESEIFSPGTNQSPVIRFRGWNIAMAVCYDMRFPAWTRNTGLKYDLLIVPANWPEARSFAWTHLLQARAIENQAYVAGCNRSGEDKLGRYTGQSYLCDFSGHFVETTQQGIRLDALLSKSAIDKFRDDFPFWKDADAIQIGD